jgi:hypothetical protein
MHNYTLVCFAGTQLGSELEQSPVESAASHKLPQNRKAAQQTDAKPSWNRKPKPERDGVYLCFFRCLAAFADSIGHTS